MMAGSALRDSARVSGGAPGELRCILRMASGRTLSVVRSLTEAGFDVWSPSEVVHRRLPRSRKGIDRWEPILPTFAFAAAEHTAELIGLSKSPLSEHPPFSVFRYLDSFPLIHNRSLDGLRRLEDSRKRRQALKERSKYVKGDRVRATSGGFEGLRGTVDATRGSYATVTFDGWNLPIKVVSCLLASDMP